MLKLVSIIYPTSFVELSYFSQYLETDYLTQSRLRLLRQTDGSEVQTSDHGRDTLLDGPRSRKAKGI